MPIFFEKIKSLFLSVFRGNERSVAVKKNVVVTILLRGIGALVNLILIPLTLGFFSSEIYGIWITLASVITWISFLDIGFSLGLKNKLTEAIAINDWTKAKSLVSTTYLALSITFVPLGILLCILVPFINWSSFLNIDLIYNEQIVKSMYVLVVVFCSQMILQTINSICAAFQKVALSSLFIVIGNLCSLIIIYIVYKLFTPSLFKLTLIQSLIPCLVLLLSSIYLFSTKFRVVKPSIKVVRREYIGELFGLGYKFFILSLQSIVVMQTTNYLIMYISGPENVAAYNIAYTYIGYGAAIFTMAMNPLWPAFTDAYVKKDYQWMRNVYSKMVRLCIICQVAVIFMFVISPVVYDIWIGNRAEIPIIMTMVVALFFILQLWSSLNIILINGTGHVTVQTYVAIFTTVIHVPVAIVLGKYIGWLGVMIPLIFIYFLYACFSTYQIRIILNKQENGIWCK